MPHVEESRHRGQRRSAPSTFCTWEGVHANVLGSIVIRLSQMGYGVLFGTTSDGGRLTLSAYLGEIRRTAYFKRDVTPVELFREIQKVLDLPERPAGVRVVPRRYPGDVVRPSAAKRTETAPEKADRLRDERQATLQRQALLQLTGRDETAFDSILNPDTII